MPDLKGQATVGGLANLELELSSPFLEHYIFTMLALRNAAGKQVVSRRATRSVVAKAGAFDRPSWFPGAN